MKWLSKIMLDLSEARRYGVKDCYSWHTLLWEAFPGNKDVSRNFLFRIDRKGKFFELLMLSENEPNISEWGEWQVTVVPEDFLHYDRYIFQVRCNPTMRRKSDRRRIAIYNEEKLSEWIMKKAEQGGFEIEKDYLEIGAPIDEVFVREGKTGKLSSVDFRGVLKLADIEKFSNTFRTGIGSAKSFGFGMLMLKPL